MNETGGAAARLFRQGARFAVVGSLATVGQLALYVFLAGSVGAQLANICAWLISTVAATAAHQHFTFGPSTLGPRTGDRATLDHGTLDGSGRSGEVDQLVGMATGLAGLGIASVALAVLDQPAGWTAAAALVGVNAAVGALRFLVLRWWLGGGLVPHLDRGHARGQVRRSMLVSAPPRISTRRTAVPVSSSTQ
jgi:hypothetical protein